MTEDLFGHPVIPDGPAMTLAERRKQQRKLTEVARGYYNPPGTGPQGETCKTCAHAVPSGGHRTYWKCELVRLKWTGSIRTDIRLRSPACKGWEPRDGQALPGA